MLEISISDSKPLDTTGIVEDWFSLIAIKSQSQSPEPSCESIGSPERGEQCRGIRYAMEYYSTLDSNYSY